MEILDIIKEKCVEYYELNRSDSKHIYIGEDEALSIKKYCSYMGWPVGERFMSAEIHEVKEKSHMNITG